MGTINVTGDNKSGFYCDKIEFSAFMGRFME